MCYLNVLKPVCTKGQPRIGLKYELTVNPRQIGCKIFSLHFGHFVLMLIAFGQRIIKQLQDWPNWRLVILHSTTSVLNLNCPLLPLSVVPNICLKMVHSRPLFLYFCLFYAVDSKHMFFIKVCQWLHSNRGPLVSEPTPLPTVPQPPPSEYFLK